MLEEWISSFQIEEIHHETKLFLKDPVDMSVVRQLLIDTFIVTTTQSSFLNTEISVGQIKLFNLCLVRTHCLSQNGSRVLLWPHIATPECLVYYKLKLYFTDGVCHISAF